MNSLLFLFHECYLNIRRNGLMSLAALGTVSVALVVLGASLWTVFRLNEYALQQPQRFNQIDVFVAVETKREETEKLQQQLRLMPEIRNVRLVPKERAWADLQQETPRLTEAVTGNPLPDKLEVEVTDVTRLADTTRLLRNAAQFPDIEQVTDASAEVRTLLGLARVVKIIGGSIAVGLFVATLFIVQNTIRLTVFARRHEIKVMQLVGAAPGFIRLPLLLEGLFHGVIGAMLAAGIVLLCGREVSRFVLSLQSPLLGDLPSQAGPSQVAAVLVAIGAFIGLVGSYLAMRRFLRQI